MTRTRATTLLISSLILSLTLTACSLDGYDSTPSKPGETGVAPLKYAAGETGFCNGARHNRYEGFLANDQGIFFQMQHQMIEWHVGGVIDATPASWPEGYEVKMIIPPFCLSDDVPGYESALFGISVPVGGPGPGVTSVPFHFFPDGADFIHAPQLILSWPGWAGDPVSDTISLVSVRPIVREGETHYELPVVRTWSIAGGEGGDPPSAVERATGYQFTIPHFSRWEMVDGDESDDGDPPSHGDPIVPADPPSCWTEFPPEDPDPFEPFVLIR